MSAEDRREAARRPIAEERAAEARARAHAGRRRRTVVGGVVAAVVLVVAVVVVVVVQTARTSTPADAVPAGTVDAGVGIPVGESDAPVTVDVYEDFQCPICASFEATSGATLDRLVEDGAIRLVYHPIAFLDRASTTDYSTRALNAAGVVLDRAGVEAFVRFHDLLFAQQPPEGGAGLSDDRLVDLAAQAGASDAAVGDGIRNRAFGDWTAQVIAAAD
ncbi:thioredoxin domain-containing protein [Geodermatophilus sp. SYSU D00703]